MKIKAIFFENTKFYMIFAKVIQYLAKKSYKLEKKDFIPNHVGFVIGDIYFEKGILNSWLMKKYDNNLIAKFKKCNIIKTIDVDITTQKNKALNIAKKNIKKYSIVKACAAFDFQSIAGTKIGFSLNAILDFFSKNKHNKTFCSEYFMVNILEMLSKKNRNKFLTNYINFLELYLPSHPILKKTKCITIDKFNIKFLAKETTPMDIYLYLKKHN